MASSLAFALCIALCICSMQTAVMARKHPKLSLEFYAHEIRGGADSTLLAAAGTGQGNLTGLGWGSFVAIDNLLMDGPEFTSTLVGKFTGFAGFTTKQGFMDGGLLVVDQFRFGPASKYNGSMLTVIGNLGYPPAGPWTVTVVGGTGQFLGYTGYATSAPYLATTVSPRYVYKWNFYITKTQSW